MEPYRRILLATDFSAHARVATAHAAKLSAMLGAPLRIVTAFSMPVVPLPDASLVPIAVGMPDMITRLTELLADEAKVAADLGAIGVETELLDGDAAHEVVRVAEERDVDLIVVGTHGRHGLSRAILGSVSDKIIRTAPCAVLAIPPAVS
ncbi:MAG: universal stress protein [Kofleriaceae bacterium]